MSDSELNARMEALISSPSYIQQAAQAKQHVDKQIRHLLEQRKWPDDGWNDQSIEYLVGKLSMMDSNNFVGACGVGEREGRVASALVARRHYHLSHGIGRSGDVAAVQPKAAGSSVINTLTNALLLDVLRSLGAPSTAACLLVPVATGMALLLCMLTLRHRRPPTAKYVIWPRIDQKSCFKAMITAGFVPIVIENVLVGDELRTDTAAIDAAVQAHGADSILCIMSTTSCFAPRAMDDVEGISRLCARYGIPQLVNNAYGMQDSKCMHRIQQGHVASGGDVPLLYVQSADKNLLVPVGGAVIAGFSAPLVRAVGESYPGRASITPTLDVLITLLHLGKRGYLAACRERKDMFTLLKRELTQVCGGGGGGGCGARVLETPHNPLSVGVSLSALPGTASADVTQIGSMLFTRNVSGTRLVDCAGDKTVGGYTFRGYMSHCDHYPHGPYLTAAAAIGITPRDIHGFTKQLHKLLRKFSSAHTTSKDSGEDVD